jgi:hypothetical protein
MSAKTRTQTLHIARISAVRATSQILGKSPKRGSPRRSCRQGSTGRKAKIRLRRQQAGKMRRKHGCVTASKWNSKRFPLHSLLEQQSIHFETILH